MILQKIKNNQFLKNHFHQIIFIIFALLSLYLGFHHELWRDEAQNWLLNRDLSLIQLFQQLKVEGHPIVWYLILKFFMLFGIPYTYSFLIPWSISLFTAYLIIQKLPYSRIIKILVLFSTPFLFVAPVLLRSYCIVVLFTILLASLYQDRLKHPYWYGLLIFLLINTHLIQFGIPLALMMISVFDLFKKENRKSALIILIFGILGTIFLFLQLLGAQNTNPGFSIKNIIDTIQFISTNIAGNYFSILYTITLIITFIYLFIKKEFSMLLVFICSYGVTFYLTMSLQKYYLVMMIVASIVFTFWNLKNKTRTSTMLFTFLLVLQIHSTIYFIFLDLNYSYSSSYETSLFIKKNIKKETTISCFETPQCSSIIPYFSKGEYTFIDTIYNQPFTYVDWNQFYVKERNNFHYPVSTDYAIIIDEKELINFEDYTIIYESPDSIFEKYIILKKNEDSST